MPAARRSVGSAKRHVVSGLANNATTLMMWDGYTDYANIISKEVFGSGSPATIESLTVWHNDRKARGWIASGGALYSISGTPYFFYDGTETHNDADQFDNWRNTEFAFVPYVGDYMSAKAQNAPFSHKTCGVLGMVNYRYQTEYFGGAATDGTPLETWDNDTKWGGSGAAAAVAAGEGSAAWAAAVASALTPTATYGGSTRTILADFKMFCQTCAWLGHTGIAWDAEGYGYNNKDSSMWATSYPSMPVGQSTATTRLYVKLRGQQLATIQAAQMPNSWTYFYHQRITGGWFELYRYALFGDASNSFAARVYDSFIAGLASVAGIDKVILGESEFYKNPVMSSWDNAYLYDHMGILARMSTLFTDAERLAAMRRLGLCGMLWPTSGSSGSELGNAMSVADFTASLDAASKWGMYGQVIVWALSMGDAVQGGGAETQDHAVFESAFQSELVAANADAVAPVCTITSPTSLATYSTAAASVVLAGTATDNMAIHRVEWANAANSTSGSCQVTFVNTTPGWNPLDPSQAPRNGAIPITFRTDWATQAIALLGGSNVITVTAYDTHGNSHTATLTVDVSSYSYNFVGQANGTAWTGWTSVAGIVDVQSEKGRLQTAAVAYEVAGAYKNTANPANFEFTANATITTVTATEFYGVLGLRASTNTFTDVRQTSSWNLRFYGGNPGPQGVCELRTVNSSGVYSAVLDSGPDIDFVQGSVLRVKVRCIGLNIKVRYWKNSETEPSDWPIDYTAADAPTGTGMSLMIRNGNDVAADRWDWDDISIASLPPDPDPSGTLATTLGNVTSASAPGDSGSFAAPAPAAISGMSATPFKDYDWAGGVTVVWTGDPAWGSVSDFQIVNGDDTPNNERSASKPSNVTIETDATCSGGKFLRLATRRETWKGQPFSGVQMENFGVAFGAGSPFFVECRLRWVGYEGCWPGPWMYDLGGTNSEIDVMETPNTRQPYTSLHPYGWSQNVHIGASYAASNDGEWHRYGLRVDRTGVYRYFDNVHVSTMTNTTYASVFVDANMGFKFQHFCGGNWPDDDLGLPRGTTPRSNVAFPNYFDCDWLRIYR